MCLLIHLGFWARVRSSGRAWPVWFAGGQAVCEAASSTGSTFPGPQPSPPRYLASGLGWGQGCPHLLHLPPPATCCLVPSLTVLSSSSGSPSHSNLGCRARSSGAGLHVDVRAPVHPSRHLPGGVPSWVPPPNPGPGAWGQLFTGRWAASRCVSLGLGWVELCSEKSLSCFEHVQLCSRPSSCSLEAA